MQVLRKVIAILAVIAFLLTAVFALFAANLARVVTDRQMVINAITETGGLEEWTRQQAPRLFSRLVQEQIERAGLPSIPLDDELLAAAASKLIPASWMEAQTARVVNAVYDYLETGDPAAAVVRLDAQPLLAQLEGDAGRQLATLVIGTLPPCSAEDVGALLQGLTGGGEIPACIPPGVSQDVLADQAHQMITRSIQQNPQLVAAASGVEIPLLQNVPPARLEQLQRLRQAYLLASRWAWTLWLPPLFALLLIALAAIRSRRTLGLWWGWPLLLAGGGALLLAWLISANAAAASLIPGGPLASVLAGVWQRLSQLWLGRVYWQAGLMFGLGLILLLTSYLWGDETK